MITKQEARLIATKLDATVNSGRHIKVAIELDGKIVKRFGIRHSKKVQNAHIPGDLGLSLSDTQSLARCRLSKEWYYDRLQMAIQNTDKRD